ncbi:MAG: sec-independent protein translocase protein TatA [Chloroflexi bacterium]|nr:MAG: sec-independent protein translocase protein TatA [Chloroflexota bacterium]
MGFGPVEAIVIVVIVLVIFGAGRLTGVGKALGQGLREFRQEAAIKPEDETDDKSGGGEATPTSTSSDDKS